MKAFTDPKRPVVLTPMGLRHRPTGVFIHATDDFGHPAYTDKKGRIYVDLGFGRMDVPDIHTTTLEYTEPEYPVENFVIREVVVTEDDHLKAACPECEQLEHLQILDEHDKCLTCVVEHAPA